MVIGIYLAIAIICAILLVIMAIFGDFGMDMDVDVEADVDVDFGDFDGPGVSPLSLPVILAFGTVFGAVGALLEELGLNYILIPVLAVVCGIAGAGVTYGLVYKLLIKSQTSTHYKMQDQIGKLAQVNIPIKKDTPGQIIFNTEERGRVISAALADEDIPRDAQVKIIEVIGDSFKVERSENGG